MTKSVRSHKSALGATAMVVASALRVSIQIAILPIIGRLLGPQAYGQVALVSPFVFFALLLAESGLGACIVNANEVTRELQGTVLCFSLTLSLAIMALFALCAYPLGALLHEPLFPALLMAMSSILLFAAVTIVPAALLLRAKKYKYIALSDVASSIGSIVGIVVGLWLGWGVWSLVLQQIFLWTAKVAVVMLAARWKPLFIFNKEVLKQQIFFGSRLTGSSIVGFIAKNIDNLLIGAFMGAMTLGYYALAFQIVGLPAMVLSGSIYFTVLSNTSEARRTSQFSVAFFLRVLRSALILGMPVIVGIAITAPLSVPLLLGDKWMAACTLIMLLAPLGVQQMVTAVTGGVIVGLGRSDLVLKLGLIGSTLTIAAIVAGAFISSAAVAIGVSVTALVSCFLHLKTIVQECSVAPRDVIKAVAAPTLASLLMGVIVYTGQQFMPESLPTAVQLLLSVIAGGVSYLLILFFLFHDHIAADIATLQTFIAQRASGGQQS